MGKLTRAGTTKAIKGRPLFTRHELTVPHEVEVNNVAHDFLDSLHDGTGRAGQVKCG